jgi:hypothetical protein
MPENERESKKVLSVILKTETAKIWDNVDGSLGYTVTPKKIELSLSDFSDSTQKEIIEKL